MIVNSVGREVGRLEQTDAIPGKPIKLTIDYDLQAVAEQDLAGQEGRGGGARSATPAKFWRWPASLPTIPTTSPCAFPRTEWQRSTTIPSIRCMDRAIQAQLAPGSVFKIFMTTAMLESKAIPADYQVFCPGYAEFYGRTFHDAEKGGHGEVDLHNAIVHSCDVYFYNVGKQLGIDRISYYATKLGLGRKTGVDLPGEEAGLVPSEEWKERVFHQKWYPGETISVSIGQGATVVTPMQLAYTIGGIAMGGEFHQPHLLMSDQPAPEIDFPISESTTDFVTQAMWGVVNEGGTAAASKLPGIEFCGKTGTAQVIGLENKGCAGKGTQTKNNAWFVGFAPRRNPEIVVAVLVQARRLRRRIRRADRARHRQGLLRQEAGQASPAAGSSPTQAVAIGISRRQARRPRTTSARRRRHGKSQSVAPSRDSLPDNPRAAAGGAERRRVERR